MSRISPTMEGFRAAFRWPSLTFSEIAWRWCVGATATILFFFGLFEYLSTLPVTRGETLFLRTRHPFLVAQALAHIFRGSLRRALLSIILAAMLLAVLWILAASIGRIANVRFLVGYFRERTKEFTHVSENDLSFDRELPSPAFSSLLRINFLRATVILCAILGFIGAAIVAGFVSPKSNPQPGLAFMLFLPMAAIVTLVAWALNWFLSLAAVLAARGGQDSASALSAAVALIRERTGAIIAVSTWTGLAHLILFSAASSVVAVPLAFVGLLPGRLIALTMLVITLVYLAIADWLYMARVAGYVCIAEAPEELLKPPLPPAPIRPAPPLQTTIDRDELILSDVPALAPQI